jgi:ubiquitin C-terminal hydrolase
LISIDGNLNTQKLTSRSKLATCFDCICKDCLNLNNIVNRIKHVFKLYAVVMHSGISLNNGHYTTFINCKRYDSDTG